MKKNTPQKIPILDLNFSAYHLLNENAPELSLQGGRVIFLFNADDTFYRLSERYNSNELVHVMDYVNALRQLRAMMISLKRENGGQK
jgi:hypothetical protein